MKNSGRLGVHAFSEVASDIAPNYLERHGLNIFLNLWLMVIRLQDMDLFKTCLMLTFMNLPKLPWLEKFDDSKVDIQVFGRGLLNHFH